MNAINIYDNGTLSHTIRAVADATLSGNRDGELTLEFSVYLSGVNDAVVNATSSIEFDGLWYRPTQITREYSDGIRTLRVSAEHEAMALSDQTVESFTVTGTVADAMTRILNGSGFSVGEIAASSLVNISYPDEVSRRAVLMQILSQCGDGYAFLFGEHTIGIQAITTTVIDLPPMNVSESQDILNGSATYSLTYDKRMTQYISPPSAPNVSIKFPRLGFTVTKPILEFSYNPFNCTEVSVSAGDYEPTLEEMYVKQAETAAEAVKTAEEVKNSLTDYAKKSDVNASVDTYLNSEEGKASVVTALSGTYVTPTDLDGYTKKTELSAEIGAYIDTEAGTAKITNALSGTYAKLDALGNYVEKTELSTEIGSYIDTEAGTAKITSAVSGTYQTIDGMSAYVKTTSLNAGISSYIDTTAGQAKIVSAVSGTYQTKSDMSNYVKTTQLTSSIESYIDTTSGKAKLVSAVSGTYQTKADMSNYATASALSTVEQSVSDVEASITLSSSYTKNTIGTNVYALIQLVSNANSSSIKIKADKIDFTGFTTFLRASDLGSSGSTTIDGGRITTGTISADRIDVSKLKVNTIYGKESYSSLTAMTTDGKSLYIGGSSFSPSYDNIYLASSKKIYFGLYDAFNICVDVSSTAIYVPYSASKCGTAAYPWGEIHGGGTTAYHVVMEADAIVRPSATSSISSTNTLGTSTYQWNAVYTKKLYLNGTEFSGGSNFAGSLVKMGGTTSYYIQATTSRQLCPNADSTSYPFYLGTSGYYWHYAYIGSVAAYIGSKSTSKIGFFGTTPVARQTVSDSASVATLITALKKYGIIA